MKQIIFLLISLGSLIPGYSLAATQDIHIEWTYDYEPTEGRSLSGYYLYQEGVKICTNSTPTDKAMDCTFESEAGTFNFTLTAFCTDGYESPHSSPYSFTLTTPSEPELLAAFTNIPTSLSGDIPLTVSFDASNSTGAITSYSWDFGDSSSATGSQTNHTYTTEGTFNATLSVTSSNGSTSQKSVVVNTTVPQTNANTHDIHIEWTYDFQPDDGRILAGYYLYKEGTKICTSNTPDERAMDCGFESPEGTFDFTLTAFCTDGFESPHSTPYTFTLTSTSEPDLQAAFGTTPISLTGDIPFAVSFDASASTGNIDSYSWNFGDNNSANGLQANHVYTTAGTFSATLTVTSTNGTISQESITLIATAPAVPPVAVITPGTFYGDAPLTVAFDGSTSTSATSYTWVFGDGSTAYNSTPNHTFTTAGTFTTTLTVTNATGQTHSTLTTITVNEVVEENTPPIAIILSSIAMGDAPLSISFDGSTSHDTEGPINAYLWNFGDGSQTTTGGITSHNYTEAGTYSASLTVTDNQGATNTTSTPVIITGQTEENQAPTARLTASATEGSTPLEVVFNGTTSTDPENGLLTYNWNFGDGATGQGNTVTHIYTSPGSFIATLTVTDNAGATSSTTTSISTEGTAAFQIELGEVEIDHNWIRVDFENSFTNPIVVAGPPSYNGNNPCVVRLNNITTTGFDIRIQEWDYLDGSHNKEVVAYLVMEQGSFTLDDGTMVEAGKFDSNSTIFQTIQFNTAFTTEPVIMTSFTTFNEEETITGRLRNISTISFAHKMQVQESLNSHGNETGNYIAWEVSNNTIDNINVIVNTTKNKVRSRWYTVDYGEQLSEIPVFLGTMQSQNGIDTSAIRYTNKTNSEIQIKIEEEQSADSETRHTSETAGYFLFSASPPTQETTNTVEAQIISSADDAEEALSSGWTYTDSSDLELGVDNSLGAQLVGLRFQNISLPQDATITKAYVEFSVDETNQTNTNLTIVAELDTDSQRFDGEYNDLSGRTKSDNTVNWNSVNNWNSINSKMKTTDIALLIQELVNLHSWSSNSPVTLFLEGTGLRTAKAYDGGASGAPRLYIEYQK